MKVLIDVLIILATSYCNAQSQLLEMDSVISSIHICYLVGGEPLRVNEVGTIIGEAWVPVPQSLVDDLAICDGDTLADLLI